MLHFLFFVSLSFWNVNFWCLIIFSFVWFNIWKWLWLQSAYSYFYIRFLLANQQFSMCYQLFGFAWITPPVNVMSSSEFFIITKSKSLNARILRLAIFWYMVRWLGYSYFQTILLRFRILKIIHGSSWQDMDDDVNYQVKRTQTNYFKKLGKCSKCWFNNFSKAIIYKWHCWKICCADLLFFVVTQFPRIRDDSWRCRWFTINYHHVSFVLLLIFSPSVLIIFFLSVNVSMVYTRQKNS